LRAKARHVAYAHDNGLEIVFFPIDFSRGQINWALDLIEKAGQGRPQVFFASALRASAAGRAGAGRHLRRRLAARHG